MESSAIGGASHLMSFKGTDNLPAVGLIKDLYGEDLGDSIPAAEHSTATSWEREEDFFEHMIEEFQSPVAVVSDTYDIYEASRLWSTKLKNKVLSRSENSPLVIRPDSGDPVEVLTKVFSILLENFGYAKKQQRIQVPSTTSSCDTGRWSRS